MADLTRHPDVVDLAEYAEGLLDDSRRAAVDQHVRGCLDCTRTLADLSALPDALAEAPVPPMPREVAHRLDRAITEEASARGSHWSGAAMVTSRRPWRRWLAPVVAAAAVVGAVAIAVPVLDDTEGNGDDSGAAIGTSEERSFGSGGENMGPAPQDAPRDAAQSVELSSDHFGRDVIDAFYHGDTALRLSQKLSAEVDGDVGYRDQLESIPDLCTSDGTAEVPGGRVDDVTYDGVPAQLLRLGDGHTVEAIAFRCDAGQPLILDAVTLLPAP
jgi:hypothetical protein